MEKYQYSVSKLKAVKQFLKDNPDGLVPTGRWTNPTLNREQWNKWFIDCLNRKINRDMPTEGRKYSYEYFCEMRHAQNELNHPRLIIDWLPKDLKERFGYRLRENREVL